MRHAKSLIGISLVLILAASCGSSSTRHESDGDSDVDGDVDGDSDVDGDVDGDSDVDGDIDGDGDVDGDIDGDADGDAGGCEPQDAREDPLVDCACDPCRGAPYLWDGDGCVFANICCCTGADCGATFATLMECHGDYSHCPIPPREPPRHPDALLLWSAPGGFAGTGPALRITGGGSAAFVGEAPYDLAWESATPDHAEELGIDAADELFDMLEAVDWSGLPHGGGGGADCYPSFYLRMCEGCDEIVLTYHTPGQLEPELTEVYSWLVTRLCRGLERQQLPDSYCVWH